MSLAAYRSQDFDIDRWLDSEGGIIKEPRHYLPFSEGPRFCLGWRLAKTELKVPSPSSQTCLML